MKPILEIQNISKRFKIRHQAVGYLSLRERLLNVFKTGVEVEDFFALKDVSFEVSAGESLGIIGRNGAGKSTLLKVLSRITPPSSGKIITRGRIASLLEVGTGFHPELTGRENIYFNGSLLGMKRKEIESNFDAIVDFSGVDKFLDTPLKHYSSGMQLRLAFSVAAFLEPEILVIDEVLAVGDAEFQKKCLGKMEDVSKSGRTILFVSHNMAAVQNLCTKGIVLQNGKIDFAGSSIEAVMHYLEGLEKNTQSQNSTIVPSDTSVVQKIEIWCDGQLSASAYMGCRLEIKVYFQNEEAFDFPVLGFIFKDNHNSPLLAVNNKHYQGNITEAPIQHGVISMIIPYLTLFAGNYFIDLHFGNGFKDLVVLRDCFQLKIESMNFTLAGEMPDQQYNRFFIQEIHWALKSK